jgi:hypothetical protein
VVFHRVTLVIATNRTALSLTCYVSYLASYLTALNIPAGLTFAALFGAAYAIKRLPSVTKYLSVETESTRPLDPRSIRKSFSYDDLLKAANK